MSVCCLAAVSLDTKHSISRMEQPLIVCQSLQDTIVGLVLKKDRHRNFFFKVVAFLRIYDKRPKIPTGIN
jgi:hypothetical protein